MCFLPFLSKVPLTEPVNGVTVAGLRRHGFVHLEQPRQLLGSSQERLDDKCYLRFSKPLLRLLVTGNLLAGDAVPFSQGASHLGKSLADLLKTCRDYHEDTQEVIQLLSFLTASAAYVLLTPSSRPDVSNLAGLRPGAEVLGDKTRLVEAMRVLQAEAAAVDTATVVERETYQFATNEVSRARSHVEVIGDVESHRLLADALEAMKQASAAYVAARHMEFLAHSARQLCVRGDPEGCEGRATTMTKDGTLGVDAWVRFDASVYAMQCKGQKNGKGAGKPGKDGTFTPVEMEGVVVQFEAWLNNHSDRQHVSALELLTTKRLTETALKATEKATRPVVVLWRETLLKSMGTVFGGIAARCHDVEAK